MSNHIIHKQEVLLSIQDIDNAFKYQQTVSDLFANGLTEAIEQTLDAVDTKGMVRRIDKLTLDLGNINATTFGDEFKQRFIVQLKDSLESNNDTTSDNIAVTKQSQSLREGFIYFIENGILPWYIEAKNMAALEAVVFNEWNENEWAFIVEWLRQNAEKNYSFIERLALQFSRKFLKKLIESSLQQIIDDEEYKLLLNDLQLIYSKIDTPVFSSSFTVRRSNYMVMLLQKALSKNKIPTLDELIASQLHDLFLSIDEKEFSATDERNDVVTALINNDEAFSAVGSSDITEGQKMLTASLHSKMVSNILKNIFLIRHKKIALKHVAIKMLLETAEFIDSKYESLKTFEVVNANNNKTEPIEPKKIKQIKTAEEDVLFVDNCGIVLLHPFLQAYFEGLLLTENKKFISEDAQKRAILLLHYLSTGETEVAEFNLVLQKILCGLDIDETLPSSIILLQDEIEESQKLLQSVIDYWPPLKNTSTAGLQSTFLQRKGKLATTDTGWQLTVEQKTVDILIGKLPWGFSTIKLPWMQGSVNVEWC